MLTNISMVVRFYISFFALCTLLWMQFLEARADSEEEEFFIAVVEDVIWSPRIIWRGLVEKDGFVQVETPVGLGPKLYK